MVLFLVPAVAGAAAYGAATQRDAGSYSAASGDRRIDAYEIWERLTTGQGADSLMTGQRSANRLQSAFQQRIAQIEALNRRMDQAWQGESAESAKAGAHPLQAWLEDSKSKLQESDAYLGEQTAAFNTAYSKVQPIPKEPPSSGFLNDITPWETDTDRAISDYNAKAQANVDAFNEYYQASTANGQSMPRYTALDGRVGDIGVDGGGGVEDGGAAQPPGDSGGGGGAPGGGGSGSGYQPGGVPGGGGGSYQPGGVPGAGSGSGGSGVGDGGAYQPGGAGGIGRGGSYHPGSYDAAKWDSGTSASGFAPSKVSTPDFSASGAGGAGGFGPGGGVGAGAGGGAGGFGPAGGFAAAGGALPGQPGSASGAAGAGGAGAGRGAMGGVGGATGRGGMAGMPMGAMGGAGRGGKGSDDEEHQTKFLVEEDSNSLFGSDELTAPPVIGE